MIERIFKDLLSVLFLANDVFNDEVNDSKG